MFIGAPWRPWLVRSSRPWWELPSKMQVELSPFSTLTRRRRAILLFETAGYNAGSFHVRLSILTEVRIMTDRTHKPYAQVAWAICRCNADDDTPLPPCGLSSIDASSMSWCGLEIVVQASWGQKHSSNVTAKTLFNFDRVMLTNDEGGPRWGGGGILHHFEFKTFYREFEWYVMNSVFSWKGTIESVFMVLPFPEVARQGFVTIDPFKSIFSFGKKSQSI